MAWQLVRRLLIFLVSAVVASMLIFLVLSGLGNPARTQLGTGATDEAVAQLSEEMGLDRPLVVQYWDWATGLLHGDFGVSYISHAAIGPQISDRLQVTLWLVLGAMIVALAGGRAAGRGQCPAARPAVRVSVVRALAGRRGGAGLPGRASSWWRSSPSGWAGCRPTATPCPPRTRASSSSR